MSLTVRLTVASSLTLSVSSTATIGSFAPFMVTVSVAVDEFLSSSSFTVYVNISVTESPASKASAAAVFAMYV